MRSDVEQQALEQLRYSEGGTDSDEPAQHREPCSLPRDEPQYVESARAQSHAQANLLRSLGGGKRNDAVEADDREHQSGGREK